MITLKRITHAEDSSLNQLLSLYAEAFPPEVRRDIDQLKYLIENQPKMNFNAIQEADELCGLLVYWNFDSFRYLEHFAVFPEKRNRKIGEQALDYIAQHIKGSFIFEVEPAVSEITTRRINYYRRNGYEILEKDYIQPSYRQDSEEDVPLWIMGNPEAAQPHLLKEYIRTVKKEVYRK
jgi:ribosomal protein S18 acetylase RimI-like enzyme